jgi:hypothetical protein
MLPLKAAQAHHRHRHRVVYIKSTNQMLTLIIMSHIHTHTQPQPLHISPLQMFSLFLFAHLCCWLSSIEVNIITFTTTKPKITSNKI